MNTAINDFILGFLPPVIMALGFVLARLIIFSVEWKLTFGTFKFWKD